VQFAVGDYLARRHRRTDWAKRFEEAVERIREGIPPDITPDEIEADVTRLRRSTAPSARRGAARPRYRMRAVVDTSI